MLFDYDLYPGFFRCNGIDMTARVCAMVVFGKGWYGLGKGERVTEFGVSCIR
jgi:hypothetical protein